MKISSGTFAMEDVADQQLVPWSLADQRQIFFWGEDGVFHGRRGSL
jgi:hypothetical protein